MKRGVALFLFFLALLPFSSSVSASHTWTTLDVVLNDFDENVNTFGGTLNFPADWTVENFELQSPDVLYWIEAPSMDTAGTIHFSGIIPGGIQQLGSTNSRVELFSVAFSMDTVFDSTSGSVSFSDQEFFLNHPAALPAKNAMFSFDTTPTDSYNALRLTRGIQDLQYAFTSDPLTGTPVLVLDSTRGAFAGFDFEKKEGDFGLGDWIKVDAMAPLESSHSTVVLTAHNELGEEYSLMLRTSYARLFGFAFLAFLGLVGTGYFLWSAYKIFSFNPRLDSPKRKTS